MSLKISKDKNEIEYNGSLYVFVENKHAKCSGCFFLTKRDLCKFIPCMAAQREDEKFGIFKKFKN